MFDLSFPLLILLAVAAIFGLAGFVKGVIGMGLPTVAMGLLGTVMPPAQAAAILVIPSLVTNVWQLLAGPAFGALVLRLWPMMAGICVGTWLGAGILTGENSALAATLLGVALLVYAAIGLFARRFHVPAAAEKWLNLPIGVATGLVTGATGVFVLPAVPYLQALRLEREELIQALGLSFTVSTLAMAAALWDEGAFAAALLGVSLLALLPALGGMLVGTWLRTRISAETFRRCFFVGLALLGAHLALRGVL
ncbi:MAG: sulfite exporter TauE/SafE family protein [Reyranellaceae bacterium]